MDKMSRSEAGRLGAIKTNQLFLQRYLDNPKICKGCLDQLPYQRRHNQFCDHSCSAIYYNKLRTPKVYYCLNCNEQLLDKKRVRKFCKGSKCQAEYKWKQKKKEIEKVGVANERRTAKRYLIDTRGRKCEICQTSEWFGKPVPLVMDHIDGHHENNTLINLRLVCGNCDMLLPTYKSKNKGNGRAYRRERYKEGKSY